MDNNKSTIPDLSDTEFISFLYSERDRENSLSLYQGWNYWALIGAIITILSVAYSALKGSASIDWMRTTYYATGVIAFFLAYHSLFKFFKRKRGYDFSRVSLLKELTPWVDSCLVVAVALSAIVLIIIYDSPSLVLWYWALVLTVQIIVSVLALINRNRLVPSYFYRPYSHSSWVNIAYSGIASGLFAGAWSSSFKKASWCLLNSEFEVGICLGGALILVYFLIKIKVENKAVEQFDAIIDRFIYTKTSKETTYQAILCNRMGYGVLEVCKNDLSKVREMSDTCKKNTKVLQDIKDVIHNNKYVINQILAYIKQIDGILGYLNKALDQSARLVNRLKEIVKIAPVLNQVDIINSIFETTEELHRIVYAAKEEANEIFSMLSNDLEKYYCQRSNMHCAELCCEYRTHPLDKKYALKHRWHRFLNKLNLKKGSL